MACWPGDEQLIVLGGCEGFAPDLEKVVFHGAYQREELPALLLSAMG